MIKVSLTILNLFIVTPTYKTDTACKTNIRKKLNKLNEKFKRKKLHEFEENVLERL